MKKVFDLKEVFGIVLGSIVAYIILGAIMNDWPSAFAYFFVSSLTVLNFFFIWGKRVE